MDIREAYEQVLRNQQLKEAPGAGAVLGGAGRVLTNPQVIRQGSKVGGSLALQKLQNWPEYQHYRDRGFSEKEAAEEVAKRLGLNVGGSVLGSLGGSAGGPWGSAAGGVLGGPALVAIVDALEDEKTQKEQQQEQTAYFILCRHNLYSFWLKFMFRTVIKQISICRVFK